MPDHEYSNVKILVRCDECGHWMWTMEGFRKVCRTCLEKLNKPHSLKEEELRAEQTERVWLGEEERVKEYNSFGGNN